MEGPIFLAIAFISISLFSLSPSGIHQNIYLTCLFPIILKNSQMTLETNKLFSQTRGKGTVLIEKEFFDSNLEVTLRIKTNNNLAPGEVNIAR